MKKYECQIRFPALGEDGQKKLKNSAVAIIGLGALGTVSSDYLARAGVGRLILVDKDKVEEVNLHRQVLFLQSDIGRKKVKAAQKSLTKANHDILIEAVDAFLSEENSEKILNSADLILDCTDKMSSRRVINNYCRKSKKIWIHAAVSGSKGNVYVVDDADLFSKHFRFEESFDECREFAVLGPVAGYAACLQSIEALKILAGVQHCRDIQRFDLWKNEYSRIRIK